MKKRIGTKLYDTESALLILPEKNLYRAKRKQTYFIFDGETLTPIDYSEAERIILQSGKADLDKYLKRVPNNKGLSGIFVSAASADKLAAYCRKNNVTQKEVIEGFIDTL